MDDRKEHLRKLGELIEDVDIAMLTTITPEGRLVSRPLDTQEVEFDGDLWFATSADSGKIAEIKANPNVNVAYANPSKNIYVSVSGTASVLDDRAKLDELWSPAMKLLFPDGKDDPNIRLVKVEARTAEYWEGPGTAFGKALFFVTEAVTGEAAPRSDNELLDLR